MKKVYPINAYQMFCADNLENIKKDNSNINHLEIQQILKCRWKTMTEKEKRIYKERATQHRKQILKDENVAITTMYQKQRKNYLKDIQTQKEKLRERTPIPIDFDPSQENIHLLHQRTNPDIPFHFRPWNLTQSPYLQVLMNGNPEFNPLPVSHPPNLHS
jgi:hypothetical protein